MEFKEIKKGIKECFKKYNRKYKLQWNTDSALIKLMEEVAEALLIYNKKSRPEKFISQKKSKQDIAKELADVVGVSVVISQMLNIDLEEALIKKWITREWVQDKTSKR